MNKAIYFDFKQGLRDVTVSDVLSEYQFAKENGLSFTYPVLAMALSAVKENLNYISFKFLCDEGNIEESTLFRCVAKLQHQVSRRIEKENVMIEDLQNELIGEEEKEYKEYENEYEEEFDSETEDISEVEDTQESEADKNNYNTELEEEASEEEMLLRKVLEE